MANSDRSRWQVVVAVVMIALASCSAEPSARELKNRQEFEMLLTAVSLKNPQELERDAKRIEERHASGELSESGYEALKEIILMSREGRWGDAEKRAYEFREKTPYFK